MPIDRTRLDEAFNPKAIAVVGAKRSANYSWLRNMQTFKGRLYSVQIDPTEIPGIEELGIANYLHVTEIPDQVDYAVIAVPRRVVPAVLGECIQKGVRTVHVFASGFAESGTPDGIEAQERITRMAEEAGTLLLGPNCMGGFHPVVGVRFNTEQRVGTAGGGALIAPRGGHAGSFIQGAE